MMAIRANLMGSLSAMALAALCALQPATAQDNTIPPASAANVAVDASADEAVLASAIKTAIERAPKVEAGRHLIEAARLDMQAIERDRWNPNVRVVGRVGTTSSASTMEGIWVNNAAAVAGLTLALPLYDGGQNAAKLSVADAGKQGATLDWQEVKQTIAARVSQLLWTSRATTAYMAALKPLMEPVQQWRVQAGHLQDQRMITQAALGQAAAVESMVKRAHRSGELALKLLSDEWHSLTGSPLPTAAGAWPALPSVPTWLLQDGSNSVAVRKAENAMHTRSREVALGETEGSVQVNLVAQGFTDSEHQNRSFVGVVVNKTLMDNGVRDSHLGAARARLDAARSALAGAQQDQAQESRFMATELARLRDLEASSQLDLSANLAKLERVRLLWENQKAESAELFGAVASIEQSLARCQDAHEQFWATYARAWSRLGPGAAQ